MRIRTVILVGALLMCATSWTQENRLGDVAGAIKLNPEAIVEKTGTVNDPGAAAKADQELFAAILADCSAVADQVGRLSSEARNSVIYPGDDLLTRLGESSRELDQQVQTLFLLRLGGEFSVPVETALDAADICAAASASVQEEIGVGGVAFSKAIAEITQCRQLLDEAKSQLAFVTNGGRPDSSQPSSAMAESGGPAAPPSDDEIVDAVCNSERSKGPDALDSCRSFQYRALAALMSRTAENEMLVEAVFSDIRRLCLELYPRDFVRQNECEQDKMTAIRLEME